MDRAGAADTSVDPRDDDRTPTRGIVSKQSRDREEAGYFCRFALYGNNSPPLFPAGERG
jgi:hypothetical protein